MLRNNAAAPVFFQNQNQNNESNISSKRISKPKISAENDHHRANFSLLAKEKNPKFKNSVIKKTLILGDFIITHVESWRLDLRMNSIVHHLSHFNFCCQSKGDETSCYGMFRK